MGRAAARFDGALKRAGVLLELNGLFPPSAGTRVSYKGGKVTAVDGPFTEATFALQVLQRMRPRRVRLAKTDRWLWVVLSRLWTGWRTAVVIVKPETVIAWHRRGFRLWWAWKSRRGMGRPTVPPTSAR